MGTEQRREDTTALTTFPIQPDSVRQIAEGLMTIDTIICVRGEPLCYRSDCGREATLQCDYRIDRWGRTCDAWMCQEHAVSVSFGRDHCTGHEPPKNQARMAL